MTNMVQLQYRHANENAVLDDASSSTDPRHPPGRASRNLSAMASKSGEMSSLLRLLSHEGRLRILELLADRRMSVNELAECVARPQNDVSMHLAKLRLARVVRVEQNGQTRHYSLSDVRISYLVKAVLELCEKQREQ